MWTWSAERRNLDRDAVCDPVRYYDRNQYRDSPPETEFFPEYTEFARRATEAGVIRGGEASACTVAFVPNYRQS